MRFDELVPDTILDTASAQGFVPTGGLFALNSYENRVYEIACDEAPPIIAKYYRPGRWNQAAITDEHRFLAALAEAEVPVVTPLVLSHHLPGIDTLAQCGDIFYAFYPKFRGRARDEISNDDRRVLGTTLARLHNIGAHFHAAHRWQLTPQTYGHDSLAFILTQEFLPADLKQNIEAHLVQALHLLTPWFQPDLKPITLHGDCHLGNILWDMDSHGLARGNLFSEHSEREGGTQQALPVGGATRAPVMEGPHLLDLDDMIVAPAVQDIWMLFNGTKEERQEQQKAFFTGYEMFRVFDHSTLRLTEPLRTLRMIRHAAWIGQRYHEPAFQRAFPYYEQRRYWEEFLLTMKEQIALLQELQWA